MLVKGLVVAALIVAVAVGGYALLFNVFELGGVTTMDVRPVPVAWVEQGWGREQTRKFHHWSQGTKILPLDWFMALEQPILSPLPAAPFASRDYLARFGFLYDDDKKGAATAVGDAPPDLPIGFAIEGHFDAPYATPPIRDGTKVVGLTCAACHTGRLDVVGKDGKTRGLLIEGGSAMIHITSFQEAAKLAIGYTQFFPMRFNRFAEKVLGADLPDSDPRKARLRADFDALVARGKQEDRYATDHKLYPIESGYARTDALDLIGNRVFGVLIPENQVVTNAPTNYPHIWDTAWFDWVQYNASIRTPMARNIGEALGVGALVNLDRTRGRLYDSTVNVEGLHWLEEQLGGDEPFAGLQPPRWDESLMGRAINTTLRDRGKTLYRRHCQGCHLPPRDELKGDALSANPKYFVADPGSKKRILHVKVIDLYEIGTDENLAMNFHRRVAVMDRTPERNKSDHEAPVSRDTVAAKVGLFLVTSIVRRNEYEEGGILLKRPGEADKILDPDRLMKYDRYRTLPDPLLVGDPEALEKGLAMDQVILDPLGYKARPLDGVWATPPFLHNGSVPTLYQLLSPVDQRDAVFSLGSKRFDPIDVGYERHEVRGAFRFDTTLSGNRNTGHEFRNMTLPELETAQNLTPDPAADRETRWAAVLGITRGELAGLSQAERWKRTRQASLDARKLEHYVPTRGVLGVEFTEDERRQLVEYLKSL